MSDLEYDWVVVGSGFGGSVAALRLAQKGYRVLVVEKGRWHRPEDFPRTNWDLRRWLWLPFLRFFGIFRISLFRHITVLSGVGVGGGSLAEEMGVSGGFAPTQVAVHFGEPGVEVSDPYFGGQGPARAGCTFCGGCMTGCRHNAKNTLDRNYLYLTC